MASSAKNELKTDKNLQTIEDLFVKTWQTKYFLCCHIFHRYSLQDVHCDVSSRSDSQQPSSFKILLIETKTKCLQSCILECCRDVIIKKMQCQFHSHFIQHIAGENIHSHSQRRLNIVTIHLSSCHPLAWPSCQWIGWTLSSGPLPERWKGGQRRTAWGFSPCLCQRCWYQFRCHQCPIPRRKHGTSWTSKGPSSQTCLTGQLWLCPQRLSIPALQGVSKMEKTMVWLPDEECRCVFNFILPHHLPAGCDWLPCWLWAETQPLLSASPCPSMCPAASWSASSPVAPEFPHGGALETPLWTSYEPEACLGSTSYWLCHHRSQRDLRKQNKISYTLAIFDRTGFLFVCSSVSNHSCIEKTMVHNTH